MQRYIPKEIEPKWQKKWDESKVYEADLKSEKPKYIAMSMFNYPSGAGIHIGHAMNYTISDVKARFKRQQGYESYHPVGWDAFGLPAENYAIKSGVSPQKSMEQIIPSYHKQYKAMGWSNDWSKEISTHQPDYYKWTQWIFSQMYKNKLAYQDSRMQWWCDKCQTVLANEQVIDGKCWRHDGPDDPEVNKKEVKQWFFKITEYADELLESTDALDWTESVKTAQKKWIGRSKGAEIDFKIDGSNESLKVFTTRPDTLYGATFMILAPEHPLVDKIATNSQKLQVEKYVTQAERKSEVERASAKEKTGVFTGAYAINPVNNEKIPIWIADYVLAGYGTGAIMAVPAHDERDNEFAKKYDLSITEVVKAGDGEECFIGEGEMINSGEYDGMQSSDAREKIVADLKKQ
ncbi:leucine--tRNA ligase, partial [Candidatus Saccharibacteria bacterium]|nr:leucine--tRNA ligase [Candidatus Saccharibacteria bacterium]